MFLPQNLCIGCLLFLKYFLPSIFFLTSSRSQMLPLPTSFPKIYNWKLYLISQSMYLDSLFIPQSICWIPYLFHISYQYLSQKQPVSHQFYFKNIIQLHKKSAFHSLHHKNKKQTNEVILKVYFSIEKAQNVIDIIFNLSLSKGIMWRCIKHKSTVVLSGTVWEIIFRENKGTLLTYFDTKLMVFFHILNMLILHVNNLISNLFITLISFRYNLLENLSFCGWTHKQLEQYIEMIIASCLDRSVNREICGIQKPDLESWFHYSLCLGFWVDYSTL